MSDVPTRVFQLPDLGEGLTEAGLVQWLVSVGDTIAVDQAIAEVETAKSVVQLPSPFAGVVSALHGEPGHAIDVGAPVLEVSGEADGAGAPIAPSDAGSGNVLIGYGTTERRPHSRRRPATRPGTTSPPDASTAPVAVRSPIVRRLARELGLDVHAIVPTGHDGAVTRADVLAAAVDDEIDGLHVRSRERLSPLRKAVSARLSRSRSEIPEATVWVDVDATELWGLRSRMAPSTANAPSLTALLARFVLIALAEHPILASRLSDDGAELIGFDGVNLGVAVDTERGLLVPVIPGAHSLDVEGLDSALRELATRARSGSLPPDALRGSTFTLNNYGGLGVDGSAAIINHPDVAILGIGRMLERPWVVDGRIAVRRIVQLSLVFDHRVCDGGYAAGFLRRVTGLVEHPLQTYGKV